MTDTKTFEDALTELETIVRNLEGGKVGLDDAVAAYEKGIALKKFCEQRLALAKEKIDKLCIDNQNQIVGKEDFNVQID